MSTIELETRSDDGAVVVLESRDPLSASPQARVLAYRTRTGALLRIGGAVRGAFDAKHRSIAIAPGSGGAIALEVERRALPTTRLPSRGGLRWRWLLARASEEPRRALGAIARRARSLGELPAPAPDAELACVGHSHLDVAWLWTYEEAARKAMRTFATAVRQLELVPDFIFTQSQPQLYAYVAARDAAFFERIREFARKGRIDTSGAAMWLEPDCNLPSGESLLRQLSLGMRYVEREFGTLPSVAWLPDSFGFPNTLPTLLAHAGVSAFATTKLGWNDTTVFPYARFVWEGPDGSRVAAANLASIEGEFEGRRVRRARRRGDVLLIGYGDGGGGASDRAIFAAPPNRRWTTLAGWFANARAAELPVVRDELYLEQHRGTLTTHHDVKARHAALERSLRDAELVLAWAAALHATPFFLEEARRHVARAWEIVLRAQFHDVLPGTCIGEVYADVRREFDEAELLLDGVTSNARSALPHAPEHAAAQAVPPRRIDGDYAFDNGLVAARVRRDGTFCELRVSGGANVVRRANRLALYVDRPAHWDAWNVDRSYRKRPRRLRATGCAIVDGALEVRYAFGRSLAVARIAAIAHEPFLRVDLAVEWRERHALLRCENDFAFAASQARFGSPHGWVERAARPHTRAERAKFEAAGQRFARVDGEGGGVAVLALDTYGWSLEAPRGGAALGHSLLRGPTWPDSGADLGENSFSMAYVPFATLGMAELERTWERFCGTPGVPMFVSHTESLFVAATKPAEDGDGIVVRVRECDGRPAHSDIRVAARVRGIGSIDALERDLERDAPFVDGAIRAPFAPFELRSFRVRLA